MNNVKMVFFCMKINLIKLLTSTKFLVLIIMFILLSYKQTGEVNALCDYLGIKMTAFNFSFAFNEPGVFVVNAALVIFLFSSLPELDKYSESIMLRAGRNVVNIGETLYIVVVSIIYTLINVVFSFIFYLPNADFSNNWGQLIYTLALERATLREQTGTYVGFMPSDIIMDRYSPITALLISIALMIFLSTLIGVLIRFFNQAVFPNFGIIVLGGFATVSYFSFYIGAALYGFVLRYIGIFSWCNISHLSMNNSLNSSSRYPSLSFVFVVMMLGIIVFSIASHIIFIKKDLDINK